MRRLREVNSFLGIEGELIGVKMGFLGSVEKERDVWIWEAESRKVLRDYLE